MDENNVAITRTNEPIDIERQEEHAPVLRVWLFEGGRLEWRVTPIYQEEPWKGRAAARAIFFLLLCAPNRQALRGHLTGILWPEMEEENARSCLRSALKVLRQVLRLPQGQDPLIEAVQNGEVLQLKGQEIIWVDADAFETLVQQASQEPDAQRALPFWQQARALLKGEVLAEDRLREWVTHRWIKARRQRVQVARRRLVRSLADLYMQRGEHVLAEELLQEHIITFPTDQDALYRLMKLLIKVECFVEARDAYERCKAALTSLGKHPAEPLKALAERLVTLPQMLLSTVLPTKDLVSTDYVQQQEQPKVASNILILPCATTTQPETSILDRVLPNGGTAFGIQLAQTVTHIHQWSGMAMFCHDLQCQIDQEIKKLEEFKSQYSPEEYTLLRRSFLVSIAALPIALLISAKRGYKLVLELEKVLPQCAASIIACWDLSGESLFEVIDPILSFYLPILISTVKYAPDYRECAANLVAQIYSLKAILAWPLNGLEIAETWCVQAFNYSMIAKNTHLGLTTLNQHALSQYVAALSFFEQVLGIQRRALGSQHPNTTYILLYLGALSRSLGQYLGAEKYYHDALTLLEQVQDQQPLALARIFDGQGELAQTQHDYIRAQQLYERALTIRQCTLVPDDSDIATSLANLAGIHEVQGNFSQARLLYEQALAIYQKALVPNHTAIALILSNFARFCGDQKEYAKAEQLFEQAKAIREHIFGVDHPKVAGTLHNLANLLIDLGDSCKYITAEHSIRRALTIWEQAYGTDQHPNIAASLRILAKLYHKQHQYLKAESLYKQAFTIYTQMLGSEAFELALIFHNLGDLYYDQKDDYQAAIFLQRALAISRKRQGMEHPNTHAILLSIARLVDKRGNK